MKHIILFILFTLYLQAMPIINISSDETKLQKFQLEYFEDKTSEMTLKEVRSQNFISAKSTLSLGIGKDIVWLRFKLHNSSSNRQELYIHNENGYLANTLDFYEIESGKTLNSLHIVLNNATSTQQMYGTDAIFSLMLDINETKDIYIKSTMMVMQYPYFTIYDAVNSKKRVSKNNSILFLLVGMLIVLALYHFMLYFTTKYREYIFYSLYLSAATTWELFLSGLLSNNFGIYFNNYTELFLLSVILIPFFLTLFAKSIFNAKKEYKVENSFLNSVLLLSGFVFVLGFFNLYLALQITSSVYIYMFIVLFITTYSIMKKGNPFALIFLLANTIFSSFMMVTNMYYIGLINYTPFIFNSASIGVVIEALILSLLLAYRIKLLQKSELRASRELIAHIENFRKKEKKFFTQNRIQSMAEMIENIAHQWRQPLAQVNASVLTIDNILYETNNKVNSKIEKELTNIEHLTHYMSKTIDDFKGFLDKKREIKEFSLKDTIESSILILGKNLQGKSIKIRNNVSSDFLYVGYESELQQVILIILNNAKDAFISKRIYKPQININVVYLENNTYKISICDNAGGIDKNIIEKIFDPYFTTKHQTQGTGVGLYMSKLIIEEHMNGQIDVRSVADGTCFNILLENNKI